VPDKDPVEAQEAVPWAPGRPAIRNTKTWPPAEQPFVEVYMGGGWCPARVSMRQDRQDGATVYHLEVTLPGAPSPAHRAIIWNPRSMRERPERTDAPPSGG
jgi:hypothetical protein